MQRICLYYLVTINFLYISVALTCNSFHGVELQLEQVNGPPFKKIIEGCIERIEFDEENTVTKAYASKQNIPTLGQDSVRNMVKLNNVTLVSCNILKILPGAFRNTPRLKSIEINRNFLEEIQLNTFNVIPSLEYINLEHNNIVKIEDGAFSNLPSLSHISLWWNKLEIWKKEWFSNTTNIEIMYFNRNKIRKIPNGAFQGLTKLRRLSFEFNELEGIGKNAFKGLKYLEHLGLNHNKLFHLDEKIFPNKLHVRSLSLTANLFNYIPKNTMDNLTVKSLYIESNPWTCPCLAEVEKWLYGTNGTLSLTSTCHRNDIPICMADEQNGKVCVEKNNENITENYLSSLKDLKNPIHKNCAQFDYEN